MKKDIVKKGKSLFVIIASAAFLLAGCAAPGGDTHNTSGMSEVSQESLVQAGQETADSKSKTQGAFDNDANEISLSDSDTDMQQDLIKDDAAPKIEGLVYKGSLKLEYAQQFKVHYYENDYALIEVGDSDKYLVVPKGSEFDGDLGEEYKIIYGPVENIYLAATSAMALFDSAGALDNIKFSGTQKSGWYIDNAAEAMERGDIVYAGKYSEPDYELLLNNNCELAIESTMIMHSPKVKEMLETLDIPVFIDRSSYEEHPLGRTEWIKVYAVLTDKLQEAEEFFETQCDIANETQSYQKTDKTIAFFYIGTDGTVVVRNTNDYIPKMIGLAGGRYIFEDVIQTDSNSANVEMSMEQFYESAFEADYIIYNASIDSPLTSSDDLIAKNELFADFKAVKEGNVWTTGKSLYQQTDKVAEFIKDINRMLSGEEDGMTYITKLK